MASGYDISASMSSSSSASAPVSITDNSGRLNPWVVAGLFILAGLGLLIWFKKK